MTGSQDGIAVAQQYDIVAESSRTEAPLRALKHGETFAVFDQHGDIAAVQGGEQGLYHDGTRFLSQFELGLAGKRPLLLSSSVIDDNTAFTVDLTNPDMSRGGVIVVPRGELHFFRSIVLYEGRCHQRLRVSNYSPHAVDVSITVRFDTDFADVFEVRGMRRHQRGTILRPLLGEDCTVLRYVGLDRLERRTRIRWDRPPHSLSEGLATFALHVGPRETTTFEVYVGCEMGPDSQPPATYEAALAARQAEVLEWRQGTCRVRSSSESFNRWIARSESDLQMMVTRTPHGLYPYAGVPWFSTPFGRDGIITALELLWAQPDLARGVLSFLAATQATTVSDAQDAQPGKILHEMRGGEMAALGEVPFARYYGSIDSTPLFVMLAAAYYDRTADRALVDHLWPHLVAALDWLDTYGDMDGDGFLEYARRNPNGLVQQGWKDSHDSVFHADGTLAEPPIALCEVQGYAYAAWQGAARLAAARGDQGAATRWLSRAAHLKARFDETFWCDELGTYALALDGRKAPCRVRTSNAAHVLLTGLADKDRAKRVAAELMTETSFVGWGLRTVDGAERRYNPMAYHNGSIWPHDNALAAAGLARYGFDAEATRIFSTMFDLSQAVDLFRLPELICGFHRRDGQRPTLYPVACAPQTWSAGSVYLLLQACLGLQIDAGTRRVTFVRPRLPERLRWLRLSQLRVMDALLDLEIESHGGSVEVEVLHRTGDVELVVEK